MRAAFRAPMNEMLMAPLIRTVTQPPSCSGSAAEQSRRNNRGGTQPTAAEPSRSSTRFIIGQFGKRANRHSAAGAPYRALTPIPAMVPILLLSRWLRSVARTLKEEQWPRHWTLLSHTGVPQTDPGHISIARSAARLDTTVQIADKLSAHAATIEAGFQTLWGASRRLTALATLRDASSRRCFAEKSTRLIIDSTRLLVGGSPEERA
jgi:hypothetical protein